MTLYIIGTGGFAREALDCWENTSSQSREQTKLSSGTSVVFVDDTRIRERVRGHSVIPISALPPGSRYVIAISDPRVRRRIAYDPSVQRCEPIRLIHPRADVSARAEIGAGAIILSMAFISSDTQIGNHCHINYAVTFGHDSIADDFTTVLPGARISGRVHLKSESTIGAGSVVLPNLTVGRGSFVGAGAVVTRTVNDEDVVVGVPARKATSRG